MSQTYPVACACGTVHLCPAGYAGSKFACQCGKVVEVPLLSELRRLLSTSQCRVTRVVPAPDVELDAELEIGSRLRRGMLPVESACVFCQDPTFNAMPLTVVCERERIGGSGYGWLVLLVPPLTPIGLVFLLARSFLGTGRDVAFQLPVRVCESCQPAVFTDEGAMGALRATPLYARLLKQYPEATVCPAGSNAKEQSPGAIYRQRERRMLSRVVGAAVGLVLFLVLMLGSRSRQEWLSTGGQWFVVGWGPVEFTRIPVTDRDRIQVAEWEAWCRIGMYTVSAAVGVFVGVGGGRVTEGLHRHFWPDPKAE